MTAITLNFTQGLASSLTNQRNKTVRLLQFQDMKMKIISNSRIDSNLANSVRPSNL